MPTFYIASPANGGNDSNPGTQALPWATLNNVNGMSYANPLILNFNAGDTFTFPRQKGDAAHFGSIRLPKRAASPFSFKALNQDI